MAIGLVALLLVSPTTWGESPKLLLTPGVAKPYRKIDVQPLIEGRVESLYVREGERIQAGAPIFSLDSKMAQVSLLAAQASASQQGRLEFAKAEVDLSLGALKRVQRILNHHAIAQREVDAAYANVIKSEGNYKVAQEEVELAKAELAQAEVRLAEHTVLAPFEGIVSRIRVNAGQAVSRQTVLLQLVDLSQLQIELQIPMNSYAQLKVGKTYSLRAESPVNRDVDAVLIAIDPVLDSGTQTFRCVFNIDNQDLILPAGFLVYPSQEIAQQAMATALVP